MKKITIAELEEARPRLERGIAKQVEIVSLYRERGSGDEDFRRLFTGFFRVRRNAAWRAAYFELFAKYETANDGLFLLLWDIFTATGNVEASFASKMLAMIDPDRPIWDSYVLRTFASNRPHRRLIPASASASSRRSTGRVRGNDSRTSLELCPGCWFWYNMLHFSNKTDQNRHERPRFACGGKRIPIGTPLVRGRASRAVRRAGSDGLPVGGARRRRADVAVDVPSEPAPAWVYHRLWNMARITRRGAEAPSDWVRVELSYGSFTVKLR